MMALYDGYRQSTTVSADLLGKSLMAIGLSVKPEIIEKYGLVYSFYEFIFATLFSYVRTLDFLLRSDTVRGQDFYRPWAGCAQGYELCCVLLFYYPL
jgi:hypothetical protein